jgi:hypothetical protein
VSDFRKTTLKRVKKTSVLILGYTRTGRPVLRPTHDAPDSRHAKAKLADWSRGDHVDASRILLEHGERESDPQLATWCTHWSSLHWHLGGRRSS